MFKLPFLNKKHADETKFLTIDITSDAVKCLTFYDDLSSLKIIGQGKALLEPEIVRSGNILDLEECTDAIVSAASQALESQEVDIRNSIIGVGGNLCVGLMTTGRARRNTNELVTEKEIDEIFSKIQLNASTQANAEVIRKTGSMDTELDLITSSVVYEKANDNFVKSILGVGAEEVEIASFSAFCPTYHLKSLQKMTSKADLDIKAIGCQTYAISKQLNKIKPDTNDYIVINVSSDFTDIAVVFSKGIVSIKTLDIGLNQILKEICHRMGVTMKEARNLKEAYTKESLAQSEIHLVRNCLIDGLKVWLSGLELVFEEFEGIKTYPSNVYVSGEGIEIPELNEMLLREGWTKSIPFKAPPHIEKFDYNKLLTYQDLTGRKKGNEWINCIALASIYEEMKGTND